MAFVAARFVGADDSLDTWAVAARVMLAGARAVYVGPSLALEPHRNAVATVAIALGTPFLLSFGEVFTSRRIALIPPNTRHHLRGTGPMAFVYLDALGDDYQAILATDLEVAYEQVDDVAGWDVARWCEALGVPSRAAGDPRVAKAVRRLDARPQEFEHLADLAAVVGLSPSRFHALFRREVGMPFRRYRLWRRMAVVMRWVATGRSLTDAAHEAGFASSAHLSTTFRDMFGLPPSRLLHLNPTIV